MSLSAIQNLYTLVCPQLPEDKLKYLIYHVSELAEQLPAETTTQSNSILLKVNSGTLIFMFEQRSLIQDK